MNTLLSALAWAAAIGTVIFQRALVPLVLLITAELQSAPLPQAPSRAPASGNPVAARGRAGVTTLRPVTPETLSGLTCRQLRAMAGTRRHLPKQHLIAMVLRQQSLAS
jgi:hypothetical protein